MIPPGCLIFDLDGTLVDSIPDLTACINRVLARRDLPPLTAKQIVCMVGDGVQPLLDRAFAAHGLHPDANATGDFLADYQARAADHSVPYPGVAETLQILADAGYAMGVCTNKPEAPARRVLEELDLARYFRTVAGGDSYPVRKPEPAHLLAAIQAAGGSPARSLMIGDHANDVGAAHAAGIPAIFAAWGYGTAAMAKGATVVIQSFSEIPARAAAIFAGIG